MILVLLSETSQVIDAFLSPLTSQPSLHHPAPLSLFSPPNPPPPPRPPLAEDHRRHPHCGLSNFPFQALLFPFPSFPLFSTPCTPETSQIHHLHRRVPSNATYAGRITRQLPSHPPRRSPLTRANDRSPNPVDSTLCLSLLPFFPPTQNPRLLGLGRSDVPSRTTKGWGQHITPMVSHAAPDFCRLCLFHMSPALSGLGSGEDLECSSSRPGRAGKLGGVSMNALGHDSTELETSIS